MAISSKKQKSSSKKVKTGSPLTANQAKASLRNLTGWHLSKNSKMISREFIVKDFMAAINLIDHIAHKNFITYFHVC